MWERANFKDNMLFLFVIFEEMSRKLYGYLDLHIVRFGICFTKLLGAYCLVGSYTF